jgi:hypothetical protein
VEPDAARCVDPLQAGAPEASRQAAGSARQRGRSRSPDSAGAPPLVACGARCLAEDPLGTECFRRRRAGCAQPSYRDPVPAPVQPPERASHGPRLRPWPEQIGGWPSAAAPAAAWPAPLQRWRERRHRVSPPPWREESVNTTRQDTAAGIPPAGVTSSHATLSPRARGSVRLCPLLRGVTSSPGLSGRRQRSVRLRRRSAAPGPAHPGGSSRRLPLCNGERISQCYPEPGSPTGVRSGHPVVVLNQCRCPDGLALLETRVARSVQVYTILGAGARSGKKCLAAIGDAGARLHPELPVPRWSPGPAAAPGGTPGRRLRSLAGGRLSEGGLHQRQQPSRIHRLYQMCGGARKVGEGGAPCGLEISLNQSRNREPAPLIRPGRTSSYPVPPEEHPQLRSQDEAA